MNFDAFAWPAVMVLSVAALVMVANRDWRIVILALSAVYLGVFTLIAAIWPFEMAVVKLVAGWIAASVLGIALGSLPGELATTGRYPWSEILLRLSAAGLVGLAVFSLVPVMPDWFPGVSEPLMFAALVLVELGVLQLGFTAQSFQSLVGLLVFMAGFELVYAGVEDSILVVGVLAIINLGIALAGAYLLVAPTLEREE